ncbi:hypothetical protein SFK1770_2815 [Shigella flexneri K-1770]|nr:hypothetical protein SFK1770_2815 [Shigella flexneri K-1770]
MLGILHLKGEFFFVVKDEAKLSRNMLTMEFVLWVMLPTY